MTNGVEITDDTYQRLTTTLKDDKDFDIGENRDAASSRSLSLNPLVGS